MHPYARLALITFLSTSVLCCGEDRDATRVLAIYFPQFHEDPTNSRLWGKGFTDWDRVRQHVGKANRFGNRIPQPTVLGYYNLSQTEVRRQQAALAREFGVDGFLYYHYWFGNPGLGPVLSDPLERMLVDGEPDLPFAFIWANENWDASWHGASKVLGGRLIQQNYTDADDPNTLAHYAFLKRFFHHKNYIKVNGAPLFMPYKVSSSLLDPKPLATVLKYLKALNDLAKEDGFPGLHMPFPTMFSNHELYTKQRYRIRPFPTMAVSEAVAYMAFPVSLPRRQVAIPEHCFDSVHNARDRPQYLGLTTTFDYTIRRAWESAHIWRREFSKYNITASFELDLLRALMYERCCQNPSVRRKGGQFIMVNAWNEWGEGMALEPSDVYGYELLQAIKRAKSTVPRFNCDWDSYFDFEAVFDVKAARGRPNQLPLLRSYVEDLKEAAAKVPRSAEVRSKLMDLENFIADVITPLLESSGGRSLPHEDSAAPHPLTSSSLGPWPTVHDTVYLMMSVCLLVASLLFYCKRR